MKTRNMPITVEQLKKFCEKQIKMGNGKKHILISQDDEGNGYHDLWYSFTDIDEIIDCDVIYDDYVIKHKDKFIILG